MVMLGLDMYKSALFANAAASYRCKQWVQLVVCLCGSFDGTYF